MINSTSPPLADTSKTIAGMASTANSKRCPTCTLLFLQPGEETGKTRTARVEELLRQNHPLRDVELSDFRQVLENSRAALEDLDSKIVQAKELLDNLLSARRQAQSHFEDTKSLLHPMRSIPSELLTAIFRYCIPTTYRVKDLDALDPRGAPWLFSEVCRRWRELALNTPQLWTHLFIDIDKHVGHITHRQCAYKAGLFIERSRGLPMEVYLGSMKNIADHPVIPALEVGIPRWRSLHVDLPQPSLRSLSGNSFLTLQRLRLRTNTSDLNVDVFQPIRVPVLRNLEVGPSRPWHAFQHIPFPWSHLTSVTQFPAFDVEALNYLRIMAELKDLEVLAKSATHTPIHDVILLPKLRHLYITEFANCPGLTKEFFSALMLPALSELTLTFHAKSVLHFPTSPHPLGNLIKLDVTCHMNSHSENTQHLLNFLTLTHHVEYLRLHDFALTLEFVDGLNLDSLTNGSPVRLPCLRIFDIGKCVFAPSLADDVDPLFEMLYSRLPAVKVEGRKGGEEMINFCHAGRDGTGQNAPSNDTATSEYDPRSRFDSEDRRRCLETVRLHRCLYLQTRREWPETFLELASRAELECAVTTRDIDS